MAWGMESEQVRRAMGQARERAGHVVGDASVESLAATLAGVGGTLATQGSWQGVVVLALAVVLYGLRRAYRDAR